jgi:hypothetical protein
LTDRPIAGWRAAQFRERARELRPSVRHGRNARVIRAFGLFKGDGVLPGPDQARRRRQPARPRSTTRSRPVAPLGSGKPDPLHRLRDRIAGPIHRLPATIPRTTAVTAALMREIVLIFLLLPRQPSALAAVNAVGCGSGKHSAEMIAAGFDVHPTDGSPEMAAREHPTAGLPLRHAGS